MKPLALRKTSLSAAVAFATAKRIASSLTRFSWRGAAANRKLVKVTSAKSSTRMPPSLLIRRSSSAAADIAVTSVLAQSKDAADAQTTQNRGQHRNREAEREQHDDVEDQDAVPGQVHQNRWDGRRRLLGDGDERKRDPADDDAHDRARDEADYHDAGVLHPQPARQLTSRQAERTHQSELCPTLPCGYRG